MAGMATAGGTTFAGGLPRALRSKEEFRKEFGFPPIGTPVVVLLGAFFLVGSVPSFFIRLERTEAGVAWIDATLDFLGSTAADFSEWQQRQGVLNAGDWLTRAALIAVVGLLAASVLRSIATWTIGPATLTWAGFVAGAISLPVVAWGAQLAVWLIQGLRFAADWFERFVRWAAPVLSWIIVLALLGAVLYAAFMLVRFLLSEFIGATVVIVVCAAVITLVMYSGILDGAIDWLVGAARSIERFVDTYVGPVIGWLIAALIFLAIALFAVGMSVAFFGGFGQSVFVPASKAVNAGRDPRECVTAAIGVGLTFCLMMCAAAVDQRFGAHMSRLWAETPLLESVRHPVRVFEFLLPGRIEQWAAPGLRGYQPLIDAVLMGATATVGALSLVTSRAWHRDRDTKVLRPGLLALGLGIALIVPILILAVISNPEDGD